MFAVQTLDFCCSCTLVLVLSSLAVHFGLTLFRQMSCVFIRSGEHRKDIRQHFLLSNADVVVKDKDCPVSGKMLSALVQALANTDRVAIVHWVKRANSPPKIYGLYPYVNKADGVYGFHAVQLPFTDDLRRQALGSLDKAGKAPSEEQLDIARRIVEKASLLDGCGNLILQSTAIPNPVIQNFHQTVIDKALLSRVCH